MKFLQVGHFTNPVGATGLTVFLLGAHAKAAYCILGAAPATRELAILDVESHVEHIDALLFTGGSAFGLGAANGVMQWLVERGQGKKVPHGVVPIVAAAAIYDLAMKEAIIPTSDNAYSACQQADVVKEDSGLLGAGTGASVGKLIPDAFRMTGGIGVATARLADGLEIVVYTVVNAVGDVRDEKEAIIAGACYSDGTFADCRRYLLEGQSVDVQYRENTTLVAVFTNGHFSKAALKRIAKMAGAGVGYAISPVFTPYDGDIVFCISLGEHVANELVVGTIAVDLVKKAIRNAVKQSTLVK